MHGPAVTRHIARVIATALAVFTTARPAGADAGCGQWAEWFPDSSAFARYAHVMVYAPTLDRLVLFGGVDDAGTWHRDVWTMTLDATPTLTEMHPIGGPPDLERGAQGAYDPSRDRLIVYGISASNTSQVWALHLAGDYRWTNITPTGGRPGHEYGQTVIYDARRDRLVAFGGFQHVLGLSFLSNDVWYLPLAADSVWTRVDRPASAPAPEPRSYATAICDSSRDRMLIFGGNGSIALGDVWSYSLSQATWTPLAPGGDAIDAHIHHTAVIVPGDRMVVFGGVTPAANGLAPTHDLWSLTLFEPMEWSRVSVPGPVPHAPNLHTAAFDSKRQVMHVFGGVGIGADEAWRLTLIGSPAWAHVAIEGSRPRGRVASSLIVDTPRHRVVAFGGLAQDWTLGDVWTHSLDGTGPWARLYPGGASPILSSHRAVFDSVGQRMIVVGGYDENGRPSSDVWALSLAGTPRWSQLQPIGTKPRASGNVVADLDVLRRRVLVWGGVDSLGTRLSELWALSLGGFATWTRIVAGGEAPFARWTTLIYDAPRDRVVMTGPVATPVDPPDFWSLPLGPGGSWTHIAAPTAPTFPEPPTGHYDRNQDRMLVYAAGPTRSLNLSGAPAWTDVDHEPSTLPPLVSGAATAFDPVGRRMILAFGSDANACRTFEFPSDLFAIHAVAVPRLGGGVSMTPDSPCQTSGSLVQLFAIPSRGNKFSRWSGDASSFLNPITITMNSAKNLEAVFLPNCEPTLDAFVTPNAAGSITSSPTAVCYSPGAIVTLSALPAPGYTFDHWTGDASGSVNPTTVTLDRSRAIGAAFRSTSTSIARTEIEMVAPNPAATVRIEFTLGREQSVRLSVLDVTGREVEVLADGVLPAGRYAESWSGGATGIYFVRLASADGNEARRFAIVR